jgi:hypothetical protein
MNWIIVFNIMGVLNEKRCKMGQKYNIKRYL